MENIVEKIDKKGIFKLMDHSISHTQILYRGLTKANTNIDILFTDVEYFEIPTNLENCKIYRGTKKDIDYVNTKYDGAGFGSVFVVEEKKFKHFIVAVNVLIQENNYNWSETSIPIKREKEMNKEEMMNFMTNIQRLTKEKGSQYIIDNFIQNSDWKSLK